MENCKIGFQYYSYDKLVNMANKLGFNKAGEIRYFLAGSNLYISNIDNPVLVFDGEKYEWNTSLLN